jgi:uncharacterized membrane protein
VRVDAPRWLAPVSLLLALAGVCVATYLTVVHYDTHIPLFCSETSRFNCHAVQTSPESRFLGVPVAVLGLAYFVLALPLLLPVAWRSANPLVRWGRLAGAIGGVGFVVWLVFAELVRIHAICLWCSSVHVLTALLFVLIAYGTAVTAPYDEELA